jgi:hypothetical protein
MVAGRKYERLGSRYRVGSEAVSQLVYLVAAIGVSVIGSLIVYYRHGRPRSIEDGVQQFSKGLDALGSSRKSQSR